MGGETDVTESNRQAIREAFEAWQGGTAPITDVFAPDMVWRIEGHSVASGEYGSRQEFVDEVLAAVGGPPGGGGEKGGGRGVAKEVLPPCGPRSAGGEPFRPVRIRSVHADGDAAI